MIFFVRIFLKDAANIQGVPKCHIDIEGGSSLTNFRINLVSIVYKYSILFLF